MYVSESRSFTNSPSAVRNCLRQPMREEIWRPPTPAAVIRKTCGASRRDDHLSLFVDAADGEASRSRPWCWMMRHYAGRVCTVFSPEDIFLSSLNF